MLPGIDALFQPLTKITGASVDENKLLASFFLSYPLTAVLKRLPDSKPWLKNVFVISISLFYLVGLFDLWDGLRTLLYSSIAAYAIAYYIDGTLMPWIGFVVLMTHMSINHIIRQNANAPDVVDITGAQMVLVMKLSAFCWNVHDGRISPELLTAEQKERAIYQIPNLLDYAGYVFFFPSLMIGPAFDYADYRKWLDNTLYTVPPNTPAPPTRKQRKIPVSGIPALWKVFTALFWLFLLVQTGQWYTKELVLSDKYMSYNLLHRIWFLYMFGFTSRIRYYACWTLTEGACILSGIGFNGVDPKTGKFQWNRLENINPWRLETAQNPRAYLENWNKNTNHWLRNYVYLRVTPKGKKPGFRASLATFGTSAFWHGFYPGYYMSMITAAFIQTVAKSFRRYVRPFFLSPDGKTPTKNKIYYDIASFVVTQFAMCFTTLPFVVLGFKDSIRVWAAVYFYTVIGVVVSMAFFASPAKKWLIKRIDKRNHPHVQRSRSPTRPPVLGLPNDPEREIDEAIEEIQREVEFRRRRGSKVTMPTGEGLKTAVERRLGKKIDLSTGQVKDEQAMLAKNAGQAVEAKKEK